VKEWQAVGYLIEIKNLGLTANRRRGGGYGGFTDCDKNNSHFHLNITSKNQARTNTNKHKAKNTYQN
jgi:hypothetical protein